MEYHSVEMRVEHLVDESAVLKGDHSVGWLADMRVHHWVEM
jgi:hypothetical protein